MSKSFKNPNFYIDASAVAMDDAGTTLDNFLPQNYKKISGKITIPSNANLNNYTTPGTYKCDSNTIAETIKNAPNEKIAFELQVDNYIDGYIVQICQTYNGLRFMRSQHNSTWSSWTWSGGYASRGFAITTLTTTANMTGNTNKAFTLSTTYNDSVGNWYPIGIVGVTTNHTHIGRLCGFQINSRDTNKITTTITVDQETSSTAAVTYKVQVQVLWARQQSKNIT